MKRNKLSKEIETARAVMWAIMLIAMVSAASAMVDLILPVDGGFVSSGNVSFDYYPDLDNGIDECGLEVNSNVLIVDSNVSNSEINTFTVANIPQGDYSWKILCSNSQDSDLSETWNMEVDYESPEVTLISPEDEATATSTQDFTFKSIDVNTANCTIYVDDQPQEYNITADNNTQVTVSVSGMNPGLHDWYVECSDPAGNTGYSEERELTVEAEAEFTITLDKSEYLLGELATLTINAPEGTTLSLDICPDGDGFVECFAALTVEGDTYPRDETLPYTNQTGTYIIDAYFTHNSETAVRRAFYSVVSNIDLEITGNLAAKTGIPTTLIGNAEGGMGSLSYEWTLANGTIVTGKTLEVEFGTAGDYQITLRVTDEASNWITESVTVSVTNSYEITITVKDSKNNALLQGVAVELDSNKEETSSEGTAVFRARQGEIDLFAFLTGYDFYESKLNVNGDQNIEIRLLSTGPTVSLELVSPGNPGIAAPGTVNFAFKAHNANAAECKIFTDNGEGFVEKASLSVTDSSQMQFSVDMIEGTHSWTIECIQNGQTIVSESRTINIQTTLEPQVEQASAIDEYDDSAMLDALSAVMNTYSKFSGREQEIVEKLGYDAHLKNTLKTVQRTSRDIHDIRFRTGITEEEKEELRNEAADKAEIAFQEVVKSISILDTKNFVKYPEQEEMEAIAEVYAESQGMDISTKKLAKSLIDIQGNIVVSTKVSVISIERMDGFQQVLTIVTKEVKSEDLPAGSYLLEYIPKEIAESASDITVLGKFEVIQDDPVLKFPVNDEIVYYLEGAIPLESFKGAHTILALDDGDVLDGVTGGAAFVIPDIKVDFKTSLIITIILLVAFYFLFDNRFIRDILSKLLAARKEKDIHYLKVLVNDALDNLDANNYDKACLIYKEVKLAYESLPPPSQESIFKNVMNLVNRIDISYSRKLAQDIQHALNEGDVGKAHELYTKLQGTYRKLDEDYKKEIFQMITAITERLQG